MNAEHTTEASEIRGGGDPLAIMYVLAAVAMGIGALIVVVLMFVPSDWSQRRSAEDVWVPGQTEWEPLSVSAGLDEPVGVTEVSPGHYVVVMEAYNWAFRPNEIRVPVGSQVTFRARSAQDYHGLALVGTPVLLSLQQNTITEASHTFEEAGEHLFVCSEYCGAGHVSMTGRVIVQ